MDPRLEALAINQGGYFTRGQAIDCGHHDRDLRAATHAGLIRRLRHGMYAFESSYHLLDAAGRHRVVASAIARKLGPHVALSHTSATAVWEMDHYLADTDTVHVTRLDGANGRREAGVTYHVGQVVPEQDLRTVNGLLVIEPIRAAVEAATIQTIESALVTICSALRLGKATNEELTDRVESFAKWQGVRRADIAVRLSDKRCESVGEVRSLYMFWREGLPRPELQYKVTRTDGIVVARTDFAWLDHRHLGEFDGLVKYGRLNPYKIDPGRAITDEKLREDSARAELLGMSRWVWAGLDPRRSASTANTIRAGMDLSRKLYVRNRTIIPLG